jgi:hypothetical protein
MAEMEAIKIRVAGMKAENRDRRYRGLSPAYTEIGFDAYANKMDGITNALRAMANDDT